MKRHLLLLALTALSFFVSAQNISVASFRLAEFDLTANTHGTQVLDQNGNTCALIKVETTQTGFAFDVGMMGIMKTEQHIGEIWVYVPYGVKHMTIQHQQLGTLRDYYFPCPIEQARTYVMQLTTGNVKTIVEEDLGGSYLVMTVSPANAVVSVDGKMQETTDNTVTVFLEYGNHNYRVEAPNHESEVGVVQIGKEKKLMEVKLQSSQATLTLNCTDKNAEIFINDKKYGVGNCSCALNAGTYLIEVRRPGHRTEKQMVVLGEKEQKTLVLNAPQPMYGKLNLSSKPANCEVFLDGKQIGSSPDVFSNILVGSHTLELRKNGYDSKSQPISIEEGRITDMEMTLQRSGSVAQQSEVQQPQPQQNEKPTVQTEKRKTFIMAKKSTLYDNRNILEGGVTFGKVKKSGWYLSCSSSFDSYALIDIRGGVVIRCVRPFYLNAGVGFYMDTWEGVILNPVVEVGCMFHFKHFSIMAGGGLGLGGGFNSQIGLGYNF